MARSFHAAHQLEESATAGDHHEHDYRAEVVVRGEALDTNGMLLDLDVLAAALNECLAELESVQLEALESFANESTTVENVAEHVWSHVRGIIGPPPQLASMRVTIRESDLAWASFDRSLDRVPPDRPR